MYVNPVTIPPTVNAQLGSAFVLPTVPAKDADVTVTLGATKFRRIELDELVGPAAFETVIVTL
jgi:hypothetical protein